VGHEEGRSNDFREMGRWERFSEGCRPIRLKEKHSDGDGTIGPWTSRWASSRTLGLWLDRSESSKAMKLWASHLEGLRAMGL
jgi:hypothetical protein